MIYFHQKARRITAGLFRSGVCLMRIIRLAVLSEQTILGRLPNHYQIIPARLNCYIISANQAVKTSLCIIYIKEGTVKM